MKIMNFTTMVLTLTPLKLFTTNFLEALRFRIPIGMILAADSQLDSPNDRQEAEHKPKIDKNHDFH